MCNLDNQIDEQKITAESPSAKDVLAVQTV